MFKRTCTNVIFSTLLLLEGIGGGVTTNVVTAAKSDGQKAVPVPADGKIGAPAPISITSEKMMVKGSEDKVFFEGAVRIQKGDVRIAARRAEVMLSNNEMAKTIAPAPADFPLGEGKGVAKIEITGDVEVRQGEQRILAQRGTYNAEKGEIVLTGEPEMWGEGYHVRGTAITFSLTQKRSFVEGSRLTLNSGPSKGGKRPTSTVGALSNKGRRKAE